MARQYMFSCVPAKLWETKERISAMMRLPLRPLVTMALLSLTVSACAPAPQGDAVNDPYEEKNRQTFQANTRFDSLVGGGPDGDGPDVPEPVLIAMSNAGTNLDAPVAALNHLLQGRVEDAAHMSWRFAINSTIGLAGLLDPARELGLEERDNDFGRTLHTWGAPQGAYVVLPVLGPSTERDTAGMVVDTVINPLGAVLPRRERLYTFGVKVAAEGAERLRFGDTYDSVLYDSADPYAQARSAYLQNRSFELGASPVEDAYIDPYEDLYGE